MSDPCKKVFPLTPPQYLPDSAQDVYKAPSPIQENPEPPDWFGEYYSAVRNVFYNQMFCKPDRF